MLAPIEDVGNVGGRELDIEIGPNPGTVEDVDADDPVIVPEPGYCADTGKEDETSLLLEFARMSLWNGKWSSSTSFFFRVAVGSGGWLKEGRLARLKLRSGEA